MNADRISSRKEEVTMKIIETIAMTSVLCALMGTVSLAKTRSHMVAFDQDTMINGTLVKKGNYEAKFDEQANKLTFFKHRRGIATAVVKEESLARKAPQTSLEIQADANGAMLTKVTFGGDRYSLLLGDRWAAAER